jgi:hypothetical protein
MGLPPFVVRALRKKGPPRFSAGPYHAPTGALGPGSLRGADLRELGFVRVVHNGVVVHEDGEVTGHTHTAAFDDEGP